MIADNITAEAILGPDFLKANKCLLDLTNEKMYIQDTLVPMQPLQLCNASKNVQ